MVVDKIADQERRATLLDGVGHKLQSNIDIRSLVLRLEIDNLTDNQKNMFLPLFRRDELLNLVAEKHNSHLIIVLNGRKSESGRDFGHFFLLQLATCSETATAAHVDK